MRPHISENVLADTKFFSFRILKASFCGPLPPGGVSLKPVIPNSVYVTWFSSASCRVSSCSYLFGNFMMTCLVVGLFSRCWALMSFSVAGFLETVNFFLSICLVFCFGLLLFGYLTFWIASLICSSFSPAFLFLCAFALLSVRVS